MTAFQIRIDATSIELFDAAEDRQSSARSALLLLASSDNLPSGDLLARTLSGVELLLAEAAQLYDAARRQS
ncbi:hypothetical protein NK553_00220 [Pseudomonas sp. ZM23]|uniref:Uncharacterized protein n=1 Tax=Pseudomonas triclosanedens TaxID=2961893 RepID=A0ABY6ZXQ0_9PSED|nr:hypothetical protein [Pseudomonas triclosanedens]MCP8462362.1 hypothetical protein [Pseudomonas triclosanedens]MCP8468000.1 hypothetical protein [Pseudomonas triclosanedens]MCP8474759.1 hypothetical protein [Pseudomonas triclosanedens]WAI49559.1 hypothetical protein OU419_28180 [Pseudomonas triclosanedens]